MFGPINIGYSEKDAKEKVLNAFKLLEIDEELFEKSPFELSGGQKRRIAIAGVIAMNPEILILDEPTAGLDPFSRDKLLENIKKMRDESNMTIIMVSHSMEEVCKIADRIIVINDGEIKLLGNCEEIFSKTEILKNSGIYPPEINNIFTELSKNGLSVPKDIYTIKDAVEFLKERL